MHKERSQERKDRRGKLQQQYEAVEAQITDQVSALPDAKRMGLLREAEGVISTLKIKRDELQSQLGQTHDEGTAWIEKTLGCFELLKAAEEMIKYGSPRVREQTLKAIASNYKVLDKKLIPTLRSPFLEALNKDDPNWWS